MKVIGLSGGIGSGKSTVSYYLSTLGIPVFSADMATRAAVEKGSPCLPDIIALLGTDCLLEDGEINRALASEKVFHDLALLQQFEKILKEHMRAEERRFLAQHRACGTRLVVLDVPLLIECDWREDVDSIWLVKTPKELRIRRAMQRDHVSEEEMTFRINSQRHSEEVEGFADVIIDNSGSFEHTKVQIRENLKKIINIYYLKEDTK